MGGFKAGHADDGRDDKIGIGPRRAGNGALGAVNHFDAGDAGFFKSSCKLVGKLFRGQRDNLGPPADSLR